MMKSSFFVSLLRSIWHTKFTKLSLLRSIIDECLAWIGCKVYNSYDNLVADADIDIIYIGAIFRDILCRAIIGDFQANFRGLSGICR